MSNSCRTFFRAAIVIFGFTLWINTVIAQTCGPNLAVGLVTYAGKSGGDDIVKVETFNSGNGTTNNLCFRPTQVRIVVTVTRKNGHVDSNSSNPFVGPNPGNAEVHIPRGALETDPVKYSIAVTGIPAKLISPVTVINSLGQIVSQSQDQQLSCCPKVNTATIQSLGKDPANGLDDLVRVAWTQLTTDCVRITGTNVSVKTFHTSGATCSSLVVPVALGGTVVNSIKAKCNAEETGDRSVQKIEATIAPQTAVGTYSPTASKTGNF